RLFRGSLGDEALEALAEAPAASSLRALNLTGVAWTARGIAALAASPLLRTVTTLDLGGGTGIGDEGAVLLAQSPHLGNLARLGAGQRAAGACRSAGHRRRTVGRVPRVPEPRRQQGSQAWRGRSGRPGAVPAPALAVPRTVGFHKGPDWAPPRPLRPGGAVRG